MSSIAAPRAASSHRRWAWWVMAIFALPIALYALAYGVMGERMYVHNLAESFKARPWGIIPHVLFGSLALLIGPLQLNSTLRARHLKLHRSLGRVYVATALVTGTAGMYMAFYSLGGMITHVGFFLLGVGLVVSTVMAYRRIKARRITEHRQWMIRSYAFTYSAVTLRIELPILIGLFAGEFVPAYQVVSWLAWVPNILVVEWYIRREIRARLVPAMV